MSRTSFRHGTYYGYDKGCRCDDCRAANAARQRRRTAARSTRPIPEHVHGTKGGYNNYGCRCTPCTTAHRVAYRARRRAAQQQETPTHVHGTITGYGYWGCRCEECVAAHRRYWREYRQSLTTITAILRRHT